MNRVYEVFEVLPNGVPQKVTVVTGLEIAKSRLHALAGRTPNECFVTDAETHQIVAHLNIPAMKRRNIKRILTIVYDEQLGHQRAAVLRSHGYDVVSIVGNQAAKILLSPIEHYDLFIVGHAAPAETRQEMVTWLKKKYPKVKILALNPPHQRIVGADYNVKQNGPETWLPILAQELGGPGSKNAASRA